MENPTNPIELSPKDRADALASLKRYLQVNFDEPVGDLKTSTLLDFFVEEIGPAIYNRAIHDAQTRLQQRVMDLDGELYAEAFGYWQRQKRKKKPGASM